MSGMLGAMAVAMHLAAIHLMVASGHVVAAAMVALRHPLVLVFRWRRRIGGRGGSGRGKGRGDHHNHRAIS
ncbi:MAG: hypothetical protein ABIW18_00205 [Sphingomicrobium sp.]